jgi:hypothetical protein
MNMNGAMQQGQQGQQQEQEAVITLGDISTLLQIIDVVSTRGGFQGQELAGVGMLRNKLEAFLRQKGPKQPEGVGEGAVDVEAEGELAGKLVG